MKKEKRKVLLVGY